MIKNITKNSPPTNASQEPIPPYEETASLLRLLGGFIKRLESFPKPGEQSETEKKILIMQQLTWLAELEKSPAIKERLASVRQEMQEGMEAQIQGQAVFRKGSAARQWEEVLCGHSPEQLSCLHKYLGTGVFPGEERKKLAAGLAAWLGGHPQQLLLALSQGAAECLFHLGEAAEKGRLAVNEGNVDSYTELLMWGLADLGLVNENGETILEISLPGQIGKEILPALKNISRESLEANGLAVYLSGETLQKKINLRRLYQDLQAFEDKAYTFLQVYGFMEKDTFREMFCNAWKIQVTTEELMRFAYLRGAVPQRLMAVELKEGKEVLVSLPWVEINQMMGKRDRYCKDIPYPVLSGEEITDSCQQLAGVWRTICDGFQQGDRDREAGPGEDFFREGLCLAAGGKSVPEIMEFLQGWQKVGNPGERALLWRRVVLAGLSVPLYMLKGYSRYGFYEKYGKYKYQDLFTQTEKKIRKAFLYELPISLQEQLADLAVLAEQGDYWEVVRLEKEIPSQYQFHEEVKLFLLVNQAAAYVNTGIRDRDSEECKGVRNLALSLYQDCRDRETESFILDICGVSDILPVGKGPVSGTWEDGVPYGWEQEGHSNQTVVKGEKIYPNAPCPCGSGKKYKKCCGRKQ